MPNLLTTASQVMCPHGGQATLTTSNTKVTAGGSPVSSQAVCWSTVNNP